MLSIQPTAHAERKEALSLPSIPHISVKVQKQAFIALAAISALFGGALIVMSNTITIASATLFLCAAVIAYRAFHMGEPYHNSKKLAEIKQKAKEEPFDQVLNKHGLTNILIHRLLPETQLLEELHTYLKAQEPLEIARLHIELLAYQRSLRSGEESILTPAFMEALKEKLAPYRVSQIFEWAHFEILLDSHLLSGELVQTYQTWESLIGDYGRRHLELREFFQHRINQVIDHVISIGNSARPSDPRAIAWKKLILKDLAHIRQVSHAPEALRAENHVSLRPCETKMDELTQLQQAHQTFIEEFAEAKTEYFQRHREIQENQASAIEQLDSEYR